MSGRFLMITATAALLMSGVALSDTARAAVAGPAPAMQSAAQSLDLTQQARRICQRKLRCPRLFQCHWEQSCSITRDYPPEHRR